MKRITPRVLRAMALVSGLALVACSSDDPTNPGGGGSGGGGTGSFNATVTGGVTASFSGVAVFAGVELGQVGWVLALSDLSTGGSNSIDFALNGSRPGPGTYQLIDLDTAPNFLPGEWFALLILGDQSYFGDSVSGTVTITSSSAELVEGTYDFQVSDGNITPVVATVTGTFSAVNGLVNLPTSKIQRRSSAYSPQP